MRGRSAAPGSNPAMRSLAKMTHTKMTMTMTICSELTNLNRTNPPISRSPPGQLIRRGVPRPGHHQGQELLLLVLLPHPPRLTMISQGIAGIEQAEEEGGRLPGVRFPRERELTRSAGSASMCQGLCLQARRRV